MEEERGVTQMTGGLEWLKMGEKADAPPVVMKGSAGTTSKLGTNYIRLELAQGKDMWEYEVKFSPSVDSKDERHKLLQQHRSVPFCSSEGMVFIIHVSSSECSLVQPRHLMGLCCAYLTS